MRKDLLVKGTLISFFLLSTLISEAQEQTYYPRGNPKKWNVEMTPFLWLPWVSGTAEAGDLTKDIEAGPIDLLNKLKMAFMINAEVSKGKFFASPSYTYTSLASERTLRLDNNENPAMVAYPEMKMNIAGLNAGMRLPAGKKILIDPYVGFRYDNFNTSVKIEAQVDTTSGSVIIDFWDPVVGLRVDYFPHPRVPMSLKGDIGGFGAGSKFSWIASYTVGYSVSTVVDLIAGFSAYGFDYEQTTDLNRTLSLATILYGFDFGVKIILPKRYKDPAIYKKAKKE